MDGNRATGLLLGLACGDALGRPVEFKSTAEIKGEHGEVTEMLGGGTHKKPPGTVTDDTELALCIAQSLVQCDGFKPADVAERFVAWYDSHPFDVGLMTTETLRRLKRGDDWDTAGQTVWESRPEGQNAGNGSVMRCVPYAIAFQDDPKRLQEISQTSSAITHADPRCTYGCAVLNRTLASLLAGDLDPLDSALNNVAGDAPQELLDALRPVPDDIDPATLQSSGYVIHTLQTGLYHGLTAADPQEGIIKAVNMGRDTDTVGAVTGAVVGARFGASAIPDDWCEELTIDTKHRTVPEWWPATQPTAEALRQFAQHLQEL
ncbi:ADP-ribosylglycohydrolase family protein [Halovenus rubra]|uniref:ADP-ribosylglycohydrolase family protein n=2 Tax=Halovenus rubra TaxID=869890 RepID=A0ABD5X9F5_9EURY|nr:ADP-ribosylglycohydrolase family protein [Halovenus rubra]